MKALALAVLAAGLAACTPDRYAADDLRRLETALALTPEQKPLWNVFQTRALAVSASRADWRVRLNDALSGERFDPRGAQAAADAARADAERLIEAWAKLDATLDAEQRKTLKTRLRTEK